MMWTRKDLKQDAKAVLNKFYWMSVAAALIINVLTAGLGSAAGSGAGSEARAERMGNIQGGSVSDMAGGINLPVLFAILGVLLAIILVAVVLGGVIRAFFGNIVLVGGCRFFLQCREDKCRLEDLLYVIKSKSYLSVVLTMFLKDVFVALWSCLLIVPGIVKGYEYRMIPYILAENPQIDRKRAFELSRQMMTGQKWNAFVLDLSFLGWNLLSVFCTCGILGVFYVNPYVSHTQAGLYLALREEALRQGTTNTYELKGFTD